MPNKLTTDKIIVKVTKELYRNSENAYTVIETKLLESENEVFIDRPIIVGNFIVANEGDTLEVEGSWGYDSKGRYQFKMSKYNVVMPATINATIEYLMRSVPGIGKVRAKAIVDEFKEYTFDVIKNDWQKLTEVDGIGIKTAKKIYFELVGNEELEKLMLYLIPLGVTHEEVIKIFDAKGMASLNIVRTNPYSLLRKTNIPFKTLDTIAAYNNVKYNATNRIRGSISNYIDYRMKSNGDLFVYKHEILNELEDHLKIYGSESYGEEYELEKELISKNIDSLVQDKKLIIEKDKENNECVYISYFNYIENMIVSKVNELVLDRPEIDCSMIDIFECIDDYERKNRMILAENQKRAIIMALTNRFSVLSGGPGTGKTQTINAIIESISKVSPDAVIELSAPTGKAAKRMTEMTGREAKTIHRLIGLNQFNYDDELDIIDADYLIIDEASMIDASLFYNLLMSLSDHTMLLLVGDHEQLPSIGPGLILRDLISSGKVETVRLNKIFRQAEGSKIINNAYNVVSGNKNKLQFDKNGDGEFYFIRRNNMHNIKDGIMESVDKLIKNKGYNISDIHVLSVMNKGPLGTISLNAELQRRFNPSNTKVKVGDRFFKPNDQVMQTVNNYDLGVFNGDTGKIISIVGDDDDCEIEVDYGHQVILYDRKHISELQLAYSTTVHKSQGSEYPIVIMPFHNSLSVLTNRNMINTAWTRAKTMVVCIGDLDELYKGIDKVDNIVRLSLIKDKLSA